MSGDENTILVVDPGIAEKVFQGRQSHAVHVKFLAMSTDSYHAHFCAVQ